MSWVKVDDHYPDHPKLQALGDDYDAGLSLDIRGKCYASANLTDGFIPARMFRHESAMIARLVEVGLWHVAEGGYMIHDYLEYNPSREEVLKKREAWRERQARSRNMSQRDTDRDTDSESDCDSSSPLSPFPFPHSRIPVKTPNPTPQTPQAVGGWEKKLSPKQLADLLQTFGKETVTAAAEQLEAEEIAGTVQVRNFAALLAHRLKHPKPIPSAPDAYTAADYLEGGF